MSTNTALTHLGDMPVETFIAEYWQKKPLLIRQAFNPFTPVLSADELAGLACEEGVESRLIIETPETGDWQLKQGPFAESEFAELPFSHWTLLVQAVDHWVPAAAELLERFRFIPSWRLDDLMISYAAEGGGVGPHYDNYDVFLLQAEGQRRWEVGGHYDQDSEFVAGKPVRILHHWEPEQSWVLEPGDMLYLPPQVGHNGVAVSDDCITYSIGYRAPQQGEMLVKFAEFCADYLKDEDRYADPDINLRLSSGEICRSDIERVRSLLKQCAEDTELISEWFGRLMTEPKYPEQSPVFEVGLEPSEAQIEQGLELLDDWLQTPEMPLRRTEGIRMAFWQQEDALQLFLDGEVLDVAGADFDLIPLLCDNNKVTFTQLEPLLETEANQQLLGYLLAIDVLYIDEE